MSNFQKLTNGAPRGTAVQGTDITSGAATSSQFLAATGSGGSAFRILASGDLPTNAVLTGSVTLGDSTTLTHIIAGAAGRGRQLQIGDSGTYSTVGVRTTGANLFLGFNARQSVDNVDSWNQVDGAVVSTKLSVDSAGISMYSAIAGQSPANNTSFWGTSLFAVTSAGAATAASIGVSGQVIAGSKTAENTTVAAQLQVLGITTAASTAKINRYTADTSGSILRFGKSRGATIGSLATITTGDTLGSILFDGIGTDATGFSTGARIISNSTGTIGSSIVPGTLLFQTATSAGTLTTALTLGADQSATFTGTITGTSINASGSVGVTGQITAGSQTPDNVTVAAQLQVLGTTAANSSMKANRYSADNGGPSLRLGKSRGATIGSLVAVVTGDTLGNLNFDGVGTDAAGYVPGARIIGTSTGTIGSSIVPGTLTFQTATSAGTLTTALLLGADQSATFPNVVGIGSTGTSTSAYLRIGGGTNPLTSTGQVGVTANFTSTTAATASIRGFSTQLTQANGITTTNVFSFLSNAPVAGSGSTITNFADFTGLGAQAVAATNNAVLTDSQTFTGNWFINQSSSSPSLLSGNATFGRIVAQPNYSTPSFTNAGTHTSSANTSGVINTNNATIAAFTIKLPPTPLDGQMYFFGTSGQIVALTIQDSGGGAVIGGKTAVAADLRGQSFVYSATTVKWHAVS